MEQIEGVTGPVDSEGPTEATSGLHSELESGADSGIESSVASLTSALNSSDEYSDSEVSSDEEQYINESLSTTIIREIQEGVYTCLVCTGEIDQDSVIWSCGNCYRVYDLDCIKDWAIRGSSTDKASKKWRCPACNIATDKIPKRFSCWCGSVTNPAPNPLFPFSCGGPCKHKYPNCIHTCSSECHPGAHPICGALGPVMKCHCGKHENQLPCLVTPYETGWNCDDPCGTEICDLNHICPQGCHKGFCNPCSIELSMRCYCGNEELKVKCHDKVLKKCQDLDATKSWIGGGACSIITKVYYDCNIHFESLHCQSLPTKPKVCDKSPSVVRTCYCGATPITENSRKVCTDPIPTCDSKCNKLLPCGCRCLMKCHDGDCVCYNFKEVSCACKHELFVVPCKFIQDGNVPKCTHKCTVLLNCRKHDHRAVCCPYEQKGRAREREKKKAIRNNTRSNFRDEIMTIEPVHICTRTCNRLKSCGLHYCEALCHSGPCGVCLESSNVDLVCNCGKTIIEAPVRCGTNLACQEQCIRPKPCGHSPEPHTCHEDDVSCPKCTTLVVKSCNCGARDDIRGVLCSQEYVSCGKMCSVPKTCGHPCLRTCSSKCTKENSHVSASDCQVICGKLREKCPHKCKLKCHSNKVGKSPKCDMVSCKDLVSISCECGRITKNVPCGASLNEESKIGTVLPCDEECIKLKRDLELKKAFNLSEDSQKEDETNGELTPYTPYVISTFMKQQTWCSSLETFLRTFIKEYKDGKEGALRSHNFSPMLPPQRRFIHELANTFKLYVETQNENSTKSVFVVITPQTYVPELKIEQAVQIKEENDAKKEALKLRNESAKFNSLIVQDTFFGIKHEYVENALRGLSEMYMSQPEFLWIKDSTCVVYSKESYLSSNENDMYQLMKNFRKVVREKSIAFDVKLCYINEALEVIKMGEKPVGEPDEELGQEQTTELKSIDDNASAGIEKLQIGNNENDQIVEQVDTNAGNFKDTDVA